MYIGDDQGRLWVSNDPWATITAQVNEALNEFDVTTTWSPLPALPGGDPGPILCILTDRRYDSEVGVPHGMVRSLYVGTPAGLYRMP